MNHQINTPLTAIFGYAGLLLDVTNGTLTPIQADRLRQIYATGQYLRSIVSISIDNLKRQSVAQLS
jgi:signal transduction histidine kinase